MFDDGLTGLIPRRKRKRRRRPKKRKKKIDYDEIEFVYCNYGVREGSCEHVHVSYLEASKCLFGGPKDRSLYVSGMKEKEWSRLMDHDGSYEEAHTNPDLIMRTARRIEIKKRKL